MSTEIMFLAGTAASIGFLHTLFGPDHYLPFIVMAKARKWSVIKTFWITLLCGIGHVGSSIVVGTIGIVSGIALNEIEVFEGFRGNLAGYAFILFGVIYTIWGILRAVKNKPHKHSHVHKDGTVHGHEHTHEYAHDHAHKKNITPWILFTIFVLGPCEPLIPFYMIPAMAHDTWGIILVTGAFAITTIATMLGIVLLISYGYNLLPLGKLERYSHVIAGGIILLSGLAITFGL